MPTSITNKHGTEIRVGQVWADNDPRCEGRTIQVVAIEMTYVRRALCEVITARQGKPLGRTREVRIAIDRFHPASNGYRLVKEAH